MPHKCARCGGIIEDKAPELIGGCPCGSKVFLYLRPDFARTREETVKVLEERSVSDRDLEWLDSQFRDRLADRKTVSLDIENVLRVDEGKFEIDIKSLMGGAPVVIKAEEGVYFIDIQHGMKPKRRRGG
jgi:predicted  nucleic acid-binding Zn-ribbon protein